MSVDIAISIIFVFLLGLAIGSFINVVIYRVPINRPLGASRSKCPKCSHIIAWYDNIPILSYVLLRGRCRHCRKSISMHYPLIELASGLLFIAVFVKEIDFAQITYQSVLTFIAYLTFSSIMLAIFFIDAEKQIIPNKLTYPGLIIGAVLLTIADPSNMLSYALGLLAGGGLLFIIAIAKSSGMGGGDVKLGAMMGVYLGLNVLLALFIGFLLGSIVGITMVILKKKSLKEPIAFGPFLVVGGFIAYFYGPVLIDLYLRSFGLY